LTERPARWPAYYAVTLLLCAAVFISYIDRTNISVAAIAMQAAFSWSETQKGAVLSAFFVGYLPLMVATGVLANRYGGKLVLGLAVVWWSVWTVLTPPAALISLPALVAARILLGLGEAAVFPATMNMIGRWVPEHERSRAVALVTSSVSLGTLFALPVAGWLVRDFGWPMTFYAFGAVGFVWAVWWFWRVDSGYGVAPPPAGTPREIPWRALLRCPAVAAIVVGHFCHNWALYVLLAWMPSYFKTTFGVSVANAGILSAAPWLTAFVMINVAGYLADRMMKAGRDPTFVRKLMQCAGLGGAALFLLLLPSAASAGQGVLLMCFAAGTLAFCMGGFAPNSFDIAPRHADVIWGISNTFATIPGIVGVYVTGWLVDRTGSYAAPFAVTAGIALFGAAVFLLLGSGRRQID
jgi:ACS family sodium-dependent inorganic phosphate cotransporter